MSIVLQGSTSGSITLQEPAIAGNTVLTLPAVTGTILTTTSPKAGNVIQVVQGTTSTQVNSSTTALTDTGLTATITPSSSSSKILVIVAQNGCDRSDANAINGLALYLFRNSTNIHTFGVALAYTNTALRQIQSASTCYLDSPSTTSAITYKTQFSQWNTSTASVSVNANGVTSTITLMEIAA